MPHLLIYLLYDQITDHWDKHEYWATRADNTYWRVGIHIHGECVFCYFVHFTDRSRHGLYTQMRWCATVLLTVKKKNLVSLSPFTLGVHGEYLNV
jgi:hypothetical protein